MSDVYVPAHQLSVTFNQGNDRGARPLGESVHAEQTAPRVSITGTLLSRDQVNQAIEALQALRDLLPGEGARAFRNDDPQLAPMWRDPLLTGSPAPEPVESVTKRMMLRNERLIRLVAALVGWSVLSPPIERLAEAIIGDTYRPEVERARQILNIARVPLADYVMDNNGAAL